MWRSQVSLDQGAVHQDRLPARWLQQELGGGEGEGGEEEDEEGGADHGGERERLRLTAGRRGSSDLTSGV